ncbi:hypothetical protein R3P38DRAFT_3226907 [Favolaschia claudopus]|uniref:Uncharacterized protein n=1 Tax=Favolaschia claudopus TaxID=2862362 RepID=A0AAV9ZSR9_9AGAR
MHDERRSEEEQRKKATPRSLPHFQLVPFLQPAIRPTPSLYFLPYNANAPASLRAQERVQELPTGYSLSISIFGSSAAGFYLED